MRAKDICTSNSEIVLRSLGADDVSNSYIEWLNDYEVVKYTEARHFTHTITSQKSYIRAVENSPNDYLWGIYFDKVIIGTIKLGSVSRVHKRGEVAFLLGEKTHWGKGIMPVCLSAIEQFCIANLGIEKLNAGYYETNIGSARVFEKCSWEIEGVRNSDVVFEGNRISSYLVGKVLAKH